MARDVSLAYRIASFYDASGINKADKSIKGFDKSLKKLGKTLGITLSAAAVVKFGKDAAKAFIEDEKAANRLATAVKNLGLGFENQAIADFVDRLELASGVSDNSLRPALQALLTTTGSLTKSQELLTQAIDISAGSGVELTTVAQDLANGYVGITKGLKKYNLGLTQAELKSSSFADIQAKLNKQFSGANAAYLETYAGKLSLIGAAASQAQEQIGQAVIDLTLAVTGASDVKDLIEQIGSATDFLVARIDNFIVGFRILKLIATKNFWKQAFSPNGTIDPEIARIQAEEYNRRMRRDYMKAWAGVNIPLTPEQEAARKKAEAAAAKRARELAAAQNKQTAELKKQAALKKAGTVFDLEQIQLVAALKGKLSAEERTRVEAQLALLNGNEEVAKRLTQQILAAQDSSGNLAKFLAALPNARNPFEYLDAYLSYLAGKAAAISMGTPFGQAAPSGNTTVAPLPAPSTTIANESFATLAAQGAGAAGGFSPVVAAAMNAAQPVINVTVQGNVIREEELINKVLAGAQLSSLSGSPSQIGRISGMFG